MICYLRFKIFHRHLRGNIRYLEVIIHYFRGKIRYLSGYIGKLRGEILQLRAEARQLKGNILYYLRGNFRYLDSQDSLPQRQDLSSQGRYLLPIRKIRYFDERSVNTDSISLPQSQYS